ncbi:MAG TPA: bifunctional glutamine synthetase adenylyltransferase/deadenyltransferase, partial [Methylophaga sp.]|nr:bifunctional glutamine synthetase adenylyltransferase/deadenyltransferase [Methylophaga sp.]
MQDGLFSENWQIILQAKPALADSAKIVLAGSDYVLQQGERKPKALSELLTSGDIERVYDNTDYSQKLQVILQTVKDENSLHQQLRWFRHLQMVRIIWRDLAGWADLAETTRDLSALADACISNTLDLLYQWQTEVSGTPLNSDGQPQQLIVLGMGKLGAGELNLSSDIDLIFCYDEDGDTQGGRRNLSHEEFFTRLGRKLIQALDNVTAEGFVFRVDMRLRPFG